jgi:hypothetical protein
MTAQDAPKLNNFKRYEQDQAFVRRIEAAIRKMVKVKLHNQDTLWRFLSCVNPTSTIDVTRLPGYSHVRKGSRAWSSRTERTLDALLCSIILNWWIYKNGKMGQAITQRREWHRKAAIAGCNRLWGVISKGVQIKGGINKGFVCKPAKKS